MTQAAIHGTAALETLRRHKITFDNTWTLTVMLATTLAVLCWYLGLAQVDIAPVIWTLAALAAGQFALGLETRRSPSPARLQWLTLLTQLLGTLLIGVGWHLFGGLQQPLFPLFIILPLLPAALLLGFWQQQLALLGLLAVLASGVLLSPDTNSFIEERYGLHLGALALLPRWLPHSRVAFADVNTSPTYDLMLVVTVAALGVAVSAMARSLTGIFGRGGARVDQLADELARMQQLNAQLVTQAPSAAVLVESGSGRIVRASVRFTRSFGLTDPTGQFLLDTVAFDYPTVVRALLLSGGDEIQGARLAERELVLRVRAEVLGAGVTALDIEKCDEPGLRGEIDAIEEPVFAVTPAGQLVLPNRSAATLLGEGAEGLAAATVFDGVAGRWWDIAPLESTRRIFRRGSHSYLVSIRRQRVAASIGELAFVRLQPVTET
jgi:PAS domain-containing protein